MNPVYFSVLIGICIVSSGWVIYYLDDQADKEAIAAPITPHSRDLALFHCADVFDNTFAEYFKEQNGVYPNASVIATQDMPIDIIQKWHGAAQFRESGCAHTSASWLTDSNYPDLANSIDWNLLQDNI